MSAKQAEDLRSINEFRHKNLCLMNPGLKQLPPTDAISVYLENNGVFKHIFAKQDALFKLLKSDPRVQCIWQSFPAKFDWNPRNESHYHNLLIEFLRGNRIEVEGARPRPARGDRAPRHLPATSRRSSVEHPAERLRRYALPFRSFNELIESRRQPRVQTPKLGQLAIEPAAPSSLKRKIEDLEPADSNTAKRQKSIEGDPQAMKNGHAAFIARSHRLKVANGGIMPSGWDPKAALNECYISAHLALGKDPPWSFTEMSLGRDVAASMDTEGTGKVVPVKNVVALATTDNTNEAAAVTDSEAAQQAGIAELLAALRPASKVQIAPHQDLDLEQQQKQ